MKIKTLIILASILTYFPASVFASYCDQSQIEIINGTGKTLDIITITPKGNSTITTDTTHLTNGSIAHFTVMSGKGSGGGASGLVSLVDSSSSNNIINLEYMIVRHFDLGNLHCHGWDAKAANTATSFSYLAQADYAYGPVILKYVLYSTLKDK